MENVINKDKTKFYNLLDDTKPSIKEEEVDSSTNEINFNFPFSKEDFITINGNFLKDGFNSPDVAMTSSNRNSNSSFEDSQLFFKNLFKDKETILNENWQKNETIQAKVINLNENEVFVDCLIDQENKIFQNRTFPISLFHNLTNLRVNKPVLIKTRLKPGAIRMDIYPGEGIVNLQLFTIEENWDSLKGKNLDSKLTKW